MKSTVFKLRNSLLGISSHAKQNLSSLSRLSLDMLNTQKAHAQIIKSSSQSEVAELVRSYCDSGEFSYARQLFDETLNWDIVSATSIIGSFSRRGRHSDAIVLFARVLYFNLTPNEFTFGTTLLASTAIGDLTICHQIHACVVKFGLQSNVFVSSSLLNHYAKVDAIEDAKRAFDDAHRPNVVSYTAMITGYLKNEKFGEALDLFQTMPEKNVVSWNAMIGGCSQKGLNEEAVNLFVQMCRAGIVPNDSTFPCLFSAAANVTALGMGRSFHASAIKFLSKHDTFIANALISFYAKCGCLDESVRAFNRLQDKNIVSWNAVISGYAQNGKGEETLEFYKTMRACGIKPNGVTLLGLLFGCTHAGLVDEGCKYFNLARNEQPHILKPEHYACVVDMLSRSGRLDEARSFLEDLPFDPGIGFWKCLLVGSQIHSNKGLAEAVSRKILQLDPKDISSYIQLSNVYSSVGDWQSVSEIRREMKERGMKRTPGCSWIEVKSKVHVFFNGDRRHPQADDIYKILLSLYTILPQTHSENILLKFK